jgi:chromosomal replication initiation ATPase DnaA
MPPDGSYYDESGHSGNREQRADTRRAGIFDRVCFLEGRLDRLEAALLAQDEIICDLSRALGRVAPPPRAMEPMSRNMAQIAAEVAGDNGLTLAELKSRSKGQEIVRPRQYAMMLMADAGHSLPSIGRFFGLDHTTIWHGVKVARARVEAAK